MAKFWPLHHIQCMGANSRKTLGNKLEWNGEVMMNIPHIHNSEAGYNLLCIYYYYGSHR